MKQLKQSIGIDVSKDDFKSCIGTIDESLSTSFEKPMTIVNSPKEIKAYIKQVSKAIDKSVGTQFIMEATGVYHEHLAHSLFDAGFDVVILLPNKAKSFIKSVNQRAKTDLIDATILSQMGLERKLDTWQPPIPIYNELKLLCRERESLIKERSILKNKIHAKDSSFFEAKRSKTRLKQRVNLANKQIKLVEKEVKDLIKNDEEMNTKVKNISLVKGLSITTIATIIAETNGFSLIKNRKQLVGYAGLDVQITQSGKMLKKGRLTKKGNSHIRKALFMPALNASRTNVALSEKYKELNERQTAKKQGILVIAKKLLLLTYALWKNNTTYDPQINVKNSLDVYTV